VIEGRQDLSVLNWPGYLTLISMEDRLFHLQELRERYIPHNEELRNLYFSSDTIREIEPKRMRREGHVVRIYNNNNNNNDNNLKS
jgi:hypothetical protein